MMLTESVEARMSATKVKRAPAHGRSPSGQPLFIVE
jgi:hypothetical protein